MDPRRRDRTVYWLVQSREGDRRYEVRIEGQHISIKYRDMNLEPLIEFDADGLGDDSDRHKVKLDDGNTRFGTDGLYPAITIDDESTAILRAWYIE